MPLPLSLPLLSSLLFSLYNGYRIFVINVIIAIIMIDKLPLLKRLHNDNAIIDIGGTDAIIIIVVVLVILITRKRSIYQIISKEKKTE